MTLHITSNAKAANGPYHVTKWNGNTSNFIEHPAPVRKAHPCSRRPRVLIKLFKT